MLRPTYIISSIVMFHIMLHIFTDLDLWFLSGKGATQEVATFLQPPCLLISIRPILNIA